MREEVRTLTVEDSNRLETLVKDACKDNASILEEASKRDSKALLSGLSQTMNTSMSAKLDLAVKKEMKKLGGDLVKQRLSHLDMSSALHIRVRTWRIH